MWQYTSTGSGNGLTMEQVRRFFFYLYVIALLCIGGSGLFIAPWELRRVFQIDLSSMPALAASTVVNQYRFLKGIEFAAGFICWRWRLQIFSTPESRLSFLVIVWAGVLGRLLSLFIDGPPSVAFIAFLVIEALTGVLMSSSFPHAIQGDTSHA
jgi:uncharacterized membrane protein